MTYFKVITFMALSIALALGPAVGYASCAKSLAAPSQTTAKKRQDANITELMKQTRSLEDLQVADQLESSVTAVAFLMSQWNSNLDFPNTRDWLAENVKVVGVRNGLMLPTLYLYQAFNMSGFSKEASFFGPLIATLNPNMGSALAELQDLQISRPMNFSLDFNSLINAHRKYQPLKEPLLGNTENPMINLIFGHGSLFERMADEKIENRRQPMELRSNALFARSESNMQNRKYEVSCKSACAVGLAIALVGGGQAGFEAGMLLGGGHPAAGIVGAGVGAAAGGFVGAAKVVSCVKDCTAEWGKKQGEEKSENQNANESAKNPTSDEQPEEGQKKLEEARAREEEQKAKDKAAQEEENKKQEEQKQKEKEESEKKEKQKKEDEVTKGDWANKKGTMISDCAGCVEGEADVMVATPMPENVIHEKAEPFDVRKLYQWRQWQVRNDPSQDKDIYYGDIPVILKLRKSMVTLTAGPGDLYDADRMSMDSVTCESQLKKSMVTNSGQNFPIPKDLHPRSAPSNGNPF